MVAKQEARTAREAVGRVAGGMAVVGWVLEPMEAVVTAEARWAAAKLVGMVALAAATEAEAAMALAAWGWAVAAQRVGQAEMAMGMAAVAAAVMVAEVSMEVVRVEVTALADLV